MRLSKKMNKLFFLLSTFTIFATILSLVETLKPLNRIYYGRTEIAYH